MDRLVAFDRDVVGFEVAQGSPNSWFDAPAVDAIIGVANSAARTLMMQAGNVYAEFFQYSRPAARNGDGERLGPSDYGFTQICLDVDDTFAEHARLTATVTS